MQMNNNVSEQDYNFVLSMQDYEGPLDVLLDLSRRRQFDLIHLPITELADQYLTFISHAQKIRLELAADYLVMASWLAWLKSRLLLPDQEEKEEGLTPEDQVDYLQKRLRHLQAIRNSADALRNSPRLRHDFFTSGASQAPEIHDVVSHEPKLYDLLGCYGQLHNKNTQGTLKVLHTELHSPARALERLQNLIGDVPDWALLSQFLPDAHDIEENPLIWRSAYASFFCASLELARQGKLHLRQESLNAPIMIKKAGASHHV